MLGASVVAIVAAGCSSIDQIPRSPTVTEPTAASPAQAVLQVGLGSLKGAPAPVSKAVIRSLNEAALQQGIALIVDPSLETPTRLEGSLSAARNPKGVKLAFEWNLVAAGNAPLRRIAGVEQLPPAPSIDVWASTSPAIIDAMTGKVVSELRAAMMAPPAPGPTLAAAAALPTAAIAAASRPAKVSPSATRSTVARPRAGPAKPPTAAVALPGSGEAQSTKEAVRDLVVDGRVVGAIPVSFGAGGEVRVPRAALLDMLLPTFGDDPDRLARLQDGASDDLSVKELRGLGFAAGADSKRITIGKTPAKGAVSATGPTPRVAADGRR